MKVMRAETHLHELNRKRVEWINGHPYTFVVKPDTKPDTYFFELVETSAPPTHLGVILGDYVHNLRSALDHLVWQLVETVNGVEVPRNRRAEVFFPLAPTRREFWDKPPLSYLTVEQVAFIEGFQPYRKGDAPNRLRNLHDFWNADKHRVINPVVVRVAEQGPLFKWNASAGNPSTWFDRTVPLKTGAKVAGYRMTPVGPDPKVEMKEIPIDIAFGEARRPFENVSRLSELTSDLIQQAADRFFV
jgi:hypothetical protein